MGYYMENRNIGHSKLWYCLHHPGDFFKIFIVLAILTCFIVPDGTSTTTFKILLIVDAVISFNMIRIVVDRNAERAIRNLEKIRAKQAKKANKIERPSIIGTLIGSAINSSNRRSDAFQRSMSDAISNSFSSNSSYDDARRAQQRQADMNARARWDAMDRQKKAEWDARDAALRGKDKAAYHYQNQADYWRKQSKR